MPKIYIKTFGCQMNEHDSDMMQGLMRREGYLPTEDLPEADLVVINTCSVREKSYRKVLSLLGRLKERPHVKVAVTGCVVSHAGASLQKRFPFIDFALGPDHLQELPRLAREKKEKILLDSFHDLSDYEFPVVVDAHRRRVNASVTVMKGCDNVCSFCIVPLVRGREVSRNPEEILKEITLLTEEGVKEILLLGQNVNSYGDSPSSFAALLQRISIETKIERIRYTSPHPKDLSFSLVEQYRANEKLCPHIHLPLQAGADRILKRMRRSYTQKGYLKKVAQIRKVRPDVAITTDLMVGFPSETEADFRETLRLVREVGFDASYSFAFSPRPGTEAAAWPDDVPLEVKKERLARLQSLQDEVSLAKNRGWLGSVVPVLVEEGSGGQLTGRTPHGKMTNFDGDDSLIGDTIKVKVVGATPHSLKGELCASR